MASSDKVFEMLLELADPTARRTRAQQIEQALRTTLVLTDADAVAILSSASRRGERLVLHAGSAAPATVPPPPESSVVVTSLTESPLPLHADLSSDLRVAMTDGCPGVEPGPALFTPLRQRDPVPGYIAAYRRRGRARFTAHDSRLVVMLSAWLSIALENLRLSSGTERLAITDDVTEVYNARFVQTALNRELRRASRYDELLSIALVEVDNLAAYKEQHGASRGGLLLREVATLLTQQLRSYDLMGRHGDNGFMLVLPQTGTEGAVTVAERMRAAIAGHTFSTRDAGAVTVSMGVASFPQEGTDGAALIAKAARALVDAQQLGKNRVNTLPRVA